MKNKLNQALELDKTENLDFIEEIFNLAFENSRNAEVEKAVSYNGLILVNQKRLNDVNLRLEKKNEILKEIDDLTVKMNFIKQKLNIKGYIIGITPEGFGGEYCSSGTIIALLFVPNNA